MTLASGSNKVLPQDTAAVGLHIPLELNAVETVMPGGNAKGRVESASEENG